MDLQTENFKQIKQRIQMDILKPILDQYIKEKLFQKTYHRKFKKMYPIQYVKQSVGQQEIQIWLKAPIQQSYLCQEIDFEKQSNNKAYNRMGYYNECLILHSLLKNKELSIQQSYYETIQQHRISYFQYCNFIEQYHDIIYQEDNKTINEEKVLQLEKLLYLKQIYDWLKDQESQTVSEVQKD